jgi:hypothetical protein
MTLSQVNVFEQVAELMNFLHACQSISSKFGLQIKRISLFYYGSQVTLGIIKMLMYESKIF